MADLEPEWRSLVHHLLFCPGCWLLVSELIESSPDQRAQRIEGVLAAEGLMAELLAREPAARLDLLDSDPGFQAEAFYHLISCAAGDGDAPEPVASVAAWAYAELDRIRHDRYHPLNRKVEHGFVLDVLKHLDAGNRLAGCLSLVLETLPAGDPKAQPLLRRQAEALLWNRQIHSLGSSLLLDVLPARRPWYSRFLQGTDVELAAAKTGIKLGRLARAPQEWMALLCHVMGCPSCRIELNFADPTPRRIGEVRLAAEVPGLDAARGSIGEALAQLDVLREALLEGLGLCIDRRRERALLWALEDLVLLTGRKPSRQGIVPRDLEPEVRELGEHVAGCCVCQEEARRATPTDFREAERLYAIVLSQPHAWEKIVKADGRAWTPAFGQLLACELASSSHGWSWQAWLRDIQDHRLGAMLEEKTSGPPSARTALASVTLHSLLDVRRRLADVVMLRGLCCELAQRLPTISVELYEANRDLLRVERRLEWVLSFLLERSGPARVWPEPGFPVECCVGRVARAPAFWRERLAQLAPAAALQGGDWGLRLSPEGSKPPDPVEWVELVGDSARFLRSLNEIRTALESCSIAVGDPWAGELLRYLCHEVEEVGRRVGETIRVLARKGVKGRRRPGAEWVPGVS